ncbi:MAG: type transport system permease protein [Frankiaceae bacterium]|nr:type transport system permease protein [Frankiaceae bacterium]
MMRLVGVELRRLSSRRLVRLLILGVFAMLTLVAGVQASHHTTDITGVREQVRQDVLSVQASGGIFGVICPDGVQPGYAADGNGPIIPPGCRALTVDEAVDQQMQWRDTRFLFARDAPKMVVTGMVIAGLLGFVLSASGIGAEWNSGMFASLLTWEPRRSRVLAAKTGAAVLFFTVVGAAVIGFQLLAAAATAQTRGSFVGMTGEVTRTLASASGRGIGLVALCAAAGTALAGIARSTAGAMAILGGYLVAVELGLRGLLNDDTRWLLSTNAQALVTGQTRIWLFDSGAGSATGQLQSGRDMVVVISAGRAAVFIGVIVLAVTLVHAVVLQRRDAT